MEQLYQKIGQQLNVVIPQSWDKVVLYAEVTEYSNRTYFYYYPLGEKKPMYSLDIEDIDGINEVEIDKLLHQLYEYIKELWVEFKNQKQEQWTNLTLELLPSGKFNIDYDYRNIENEDTYEKQIIWEYERLGITPKETRPRDLKILEEYKKQRFH